MKRVQPKHRPGNVIRTFLLAFGIITSLSLLIGILILYQERSRDTVVTEKVLIAANDIPSMDSIKPDMLGLMELPVEAIPENALREDDVGTIVGKKSPVTIRKNDILQPSFFNASKDTLSAGIANIMPDNTRLLYIRRDDVHAIPPELARDNLVVITAIPNDSDVAPAPVRILTGVRVYDIIRSSGENLDNIEMAGILLEEDQIDTMARYLTDDWTLQVVLLPQSEASITESAILSPGSTASETTASPSAELTEIPPKQ